MNQLKSLDELAGKTIAKAVRDVDGRDVVVLFTDHSVVTFCTDCEDRSVQIDGICTMSDRTRLLFGLISQAEYDELDRRRREADQASETARQRSLYEQLKRKFDNP